MPGGIDDQLDAIGVVLKEEFYCANCTEKMKEIARKIYKCLRCGMVFEDN